MNQQNIRRTFHIILLIIFIGFIGFLGSVATAYHILTTEEGLLSSEGCYIGAYLGGSQGSNNNLDVNYYAKAQENPWETQIWDHPKPYGERATDGLAGIDTGIDTFRSGVESILPGTGNKQMLFSRYYNLMYYPDSDYGKIPYVPSSSCLIWAERVLQQGGIPVIVLYPWSFQKNGILDLSSTNPKGTKGVDIVTEIAEQCDALSKKYKDTSGKPATILICFGLEYNAQSIVNPTSNDHVDDANKKAWRKMYRQVYSIVHNHANPSVQLIWAGNVAQTKEDRWYYWPGTDDNGVAMSQDSVDWVGMTWYPWQGGPTSLTEFTGFYDYYSKGKGHPFIFMETSADGWGDKDLEKKFKENQVKYLYNTSTLSAYPNIKGIIWFNVIKAEQKSGSDSTLVQKNYLIPDGEWDNHAQSTQIPGTLYSKSDRNNMMSTLYPDAAADPYFLGMSGTLIVADYTIGFGRNATTIKLIGNSTGPINSWKWDVNEDDIPEYMTQNASHTYPGFGKYSINLSITSNEYIITEMRKVQIPGGMLKEKVFLSLGTNPEGAACYVDNTLIGMTNQTESYYWVSSGFHTVRISKSGYVDWTGTYSLKWPEMKSLGIINLTKT